MKVRKFHQSTAEHFSTASKKPVVFKVWSVCYEVSLTHVLEDHG